MCNFLGLPDPQFGRFGVLPLPSAFKQIGVNGVPLGNFTKNFSIPFALELMMILIEMLYDKFNLWKTFRFIAS